MTIDPVTLKSNEKIIRKASRKNVRPFKRLVIWAKMRGFWEMYDFHISRWPQYLEATYVYECMLMREGLQSIRVSLFPLEGKIPDDPPMDTLPVYREVMGLFRPSYMTQRGF